MPVTPFQNFNAQLTRAPYLTDLTSTSVEVTWASTSSARGTVKWGPAGNCTQFSAAVPASLPPSEPAAGTPASVLGRQFTVGSTSEYQSGVQLSGLTPSTTYCLRVFTGGSSPVDLLGTNPSVSFTTLDAPGSTAPLTFDVVGDLGETRYTAGQDFPGSLNTDQAAIDQLIGQSGARFLVITGDSAYPGGTQTSYGDLQLTGTATSEVFGPSYWPQTGGIPTFADDGNHGQNVTLLRTWPESTTAAASGGRYAYDLYPSVNGTTAASYPSMWYAIQSGNVRIYMLTAAWADQNTGNATGTACGAAGSSQASSCLAYEADAAQHWTTASAEYQWLQQDLAAHPGGVKFAVFHYPLRSDNSTQPSDVYLQNDPADPDQQTSLETLLSANGVDLVFNGHAHTYQRIRPHAAGTVPNYVTGGGGAILEPVTGGGTCTKLKASADVYALGWSPTSGNGSTCGGTAPLSAAQVYHFLKVTVSGNTITVSPMNAAGQVFDVQTYTVTP